MKTRILMIAILAAGALGLAGTAMADHGFHVDPHGYNHHPGDPACSECGFDPNTGYVEPIEAPPSLSLFDMLFGVDGTWQDDGSFVPNGAAAASSSDPGMDDTPSVARIYEDLFGADEWLEADEPVSPYDAAAAAAQEASDAAWAQVDAALAADAAEKAAAAAAAAAAEAAKNAAAAAAAQAARAAALIAQVQGRASHSYVPAHHVRVRRIEMRR